MQQKQTRLRRDRCSNLVGDFLSGAPFEIFFRQENLNVIEQFSLIVRRQSSEERNVAFNDLEPLVRKRPRLDPIPLSIFQKPEH